jgi:hypothetical protein
VDGHPVPAGSHNDIALTRSTDGGRTWTAPIKVNSTPDASTGHNGHAFTPSVHVLPDGTVGVSYYDFRFNNPASGGTDTDHWLVHCHAALEDCSQASSWDEEVRVTPTSFDSRQAPVAGGFFLGDYVGLDDHGTRFTAFFAEGRVNHEPHRHLLLGDHPIGRAPQGVMGASNRRRRRTPRCSRSFQAERRVLVGEQEEIGADPCAPADDAHDKGA